MFFAQNRKEKELEQNKSSKVQNTSIYFNDQVPEYIKEPYVVINLDVP